jgi:phytoene synthase
VEGRAVRRRDTNFYHSFLVLPAEKRHAIVAIWDFCRAVDDAVDEGAGVGPGDREGAGAELGTWRSELDACFTSRDPGTPQGRRLKPFVAAFKLSRGNFENVIDGVEMDLRRVRYEDFTALREYCVRVASAVGLIAIEVFGCRSLQAREYAVNLGIALQLTNIIRDVKEDLARGRLYVPLDDLARSGCSEADLRAGLVTESTRGLLSHQCTRARSYYDLAERGLASDERRPLVAARIMGAIYFGILKEIERRDYDVFSTVVRVPRPKRAVIAATTWARTMLGF